MIMFHHDDEPGASVRSGMISCVGLVVTRTERLRGVSRAKSS